MSGAKTIHIIEDDETDRLIVRLFLEQAGFQVLESSSAEEGLEACARTRPDLMLIDGLLPGMDGIQMVQALRAIPEYRDTPILVLSGLEEPQWPARALAAGATGFILKSNNWDTLVGDIRKYLADTD